MDREEIMKMWDSWREYIAEGGKGSWPRDSFESVLDNYDEEIESLNNWIADLQSDMYINCVYCGHRYPPGIPEVRDKVLYEHIRKCPKHSLSKALNKNQSLIKSLQKIIDLDPGLWKTAQKIAREAIHAQ